MSVKELENIILEAADRDAADLHESILRALPQNCQDLELIRSHVPFLLESWSESGDMSAARAAFALDLLMAVPLESQISRAVLEKALKTLLDPEIPRAAAVKASGARDSLLPISEAARRAKLLSAVHPGTAAYFAAAKEFVLIAGIDPLTGEVAAEGVRSKTKWKIPVEDLPCRTTVFKRADGLMDTISPAVAPGVSYPLWKERVASLSVVAPAEEEIKQMAAAAFLPSVMKPDAFTSWMDGAVSDAAGGRELQRSASSARTIKELHVILSAAASGCRDVDDPVEVDGIRTVMSKFPQEPSPSEALMLLECAALLAPKLRDEQILRIFECLRSLPLWSSGTDEKSAAARTAWEKIDFKLVPSALRVARILLSERGLAAYCNFLPAKCWQLAAAECGIENLMKEIAAAPLLSADALAWIWKNRKTKAFAPAMRRLDFRSCIRALDSSASSSSSSKKDLKAMLSSDQDFQTHILHGVKDDPVVVMDLLAASGSFEQDEVKSLLVKLSRVSAELREFMRSEKGRGVAAQFKPQRETGSDKGGELLITSQKSFRMKMKELDRIINKDIPENTSAIAHARGFGDLRENAEYSAAKERQRFLNRRRAELEHELLSVRPVDFRNIVPGDRVVPGTSVIVEDESGSTTTYHLMGAWDGDPDRGILSCGSALARTLIGKMRSEKFQSADGKNLKIADIRKLPDEMLHEFADE